jgi:acetylornithine deacetylase/succinyl-diaminopimelate desuccinylase-like protein
MDLNFSLRNYVDQHRDRLVDELKSFLRRPGISTTGVGIEDTVQFLFDELTRLGFQSRVLRLENANPVVYGEAGDPSASVTICIYGHYDVQAPDPLSEWHSDPFEPVVRDGLIYARGATDDKGNLFANIKASETVLTVLGRLPLRLKFFFEGEEEIGSPNLKRYLETYQDLLKSDMTILCDRGVHESGRPQIYLGNKGLVSVRVSCRRARRDVHSGHAPLIPSGVWDLVRLLGSLKDEREKILVPGHYDNVLQPSEEELKLLEKIPFDPETFKMQYGIRKTLANGSPVDLLRALLFRPTCNISGIAAGWTGQKPKTIIPAAATAILDFRLVKKQGLNEIKEKVTRAIEASPFGPFDLEVRGEFEEYRVSPSHPWARLAIETAKEVTGKDPVVWPLLDGSGPLVLFPRYIGGETFIIGLGAPFETANTHAPNENIGIDHYLTGIVQMAALLIKGSRISS